MYPKNQDDIRNNGVPGSFKSAKRPLYKQAFGSNLLFCCVLYTRRRGVNATQKSQIVDMHNLLRANVTPTASNMLKMSWDDDIALVAQTYAENCVFEHDDSYKRMIPGRYDVGQNLAAADYFSWSDVIFVSWHGEVTDFTYGSAPAANAVVGHYTQVVWAKSHKIGCGYAQCTNLTYDNNGNVFPTGHLYVCNYAPAGNDAASLYTPYSNGTSCGDCPNTCDSTYNRLCDCMANDCYNYGTFDVNTCSCSCYDSFYVGDACVLNCSAVSNGGFCSDYNITHCSMYSNLPFLCPDDSTCNFCQEADSTHLLASSDTCACLHGGIYTHVVIGDPCNCTGTGFEGITCQTVKYNVYMIHVTV